MSMYHLLVLITIEVNLIIYDYDALTLTDFYIVWYLCISSD